MSVEFQVIDKSISKTVLSVGLRLVVFCCMIGQIPQITEDENLSRRSRNG